MDHYPLQNWMQLRISETRMCSSTTSSLPWARIMRYQVTAVFSHFTPLSTAMVCSESGAHEELGLHVLSAIVRGKHNVTKLIIVSEHVCLLHAGPTLVNSSLSRRFHIIGVRGATRTITRSCITCRRTSARPRPQLMGQLPLKRVSPGVIFEQVGVDFAGPLYHVFTSPLLSRPMPAYSLPYL